MLIFQVVDAHTCIIYYHTVYARFQRFKIINVSILAYWTCLKQITSSVIKNITLHWYTHKMYKYTYFSFGKRNTYAIYFHVPYYSNRFSVQLCIVSVITTILYNNIINRDHGTPQIYYYTRGFIFLTYLIITHVGSFGLWKR